MSGVCSCQFLVNSESNNEVNSCQRCRIFEVLLKGTLDELNSTQIINRILQKEIQACTVPTSTWGLNPDPTNNKLYGLTVRDGQ